MLKQIYKFFSGKAGGADNTFQQAFSYICAGMDRNSDCFIDPGVNEGKMASFLTVFGKSSFFKSAYELFSCNNRNFRAHEGKPIEISSTWTNFSCCGISLRCLERDAR